MPMEFDLAMQQLELSLSNTDFPSLVHDNVSTVLPNDASSLRMVHIVDLQWSMPRNKIQTKVMKSSYPPVPQKKLKKKKNTLLYFLKVFLNFSKPCIRSKYQAFYSKKSTFYLLATMREKHSIMNEPYVSKKVLRVFTYIIMYM